MKIIALAAALACLSFSSAWADPPPAAAPPYRPGVSLQPVTLYDKDGNVIGSLGGGSVTAAGTNGSQAQAVQGITGGVLVGISAATLEASNAAINAATGTQADAATASGANTSIIGALRAIRDRLLATLTVSVGSSALPTGAATAANQAAELASLATIAQRAVIYNDASNQSVTANTTQNFAVHDLGAAPVYAKINAVLFASAAGTAQLQACQDGACGVAYILSTQAVGAGQFATLTAPVTARYFRVSYQMSGTTGTVSANTSATAN